MDKKHQIVLLIFLSILLGSSFNLFIDEVSTDSNIYLENANYNPNIYTNELSSEEKAEITDIIDSLKEDYALTMDEVYFTKNRTFMDNLCGNKCYGQNHRYVNENTEWIWKSQIYVYVSNDMNQVKQTLCHELAHQFVKKEEYYHKFVYDLAREGVCYR